MLICPRCRTTYPDDAKHCPIDGRRPVEQAEYDAAGDDPLLGTTLAERYTLIGRVGAGGMGTVYRAEQAPIGRLVALKVLRRDLGTDPETVARFQREARTLSQLKHPNTVTIFDFGQTRDGLLYLAMELLEGEMLSVRLKRQGAMDVGFSVRTAKGVLRSLDEAHARGIIHRDLKPDNIFLARVHGREDEAEVVKVVDFGIAKIRDPEPRGLDPLTTQEGTVFGTPRYMSPEQAQGRTLDGRSDLYAVGVLLFHMLTGRPPFTEDDAVVVMANHIKVKPPTLGEAAPGQAFPPALEALVAQCLAKDPADRPQTAEAFLELLGSAVEGTARITVPSTPPTSTEVPTPAPPTPAPRRGSSAVFLVAALVVGLIAGLTTLSGGTAEERPRSPTRPLRGSSTAEALAQAPAAAGQLVRPPEPTAAPPPERARGEPGRAPADTAGPGVPEPTPAPLAVPEAQPTPPPVLATPEEPPTERRRGHGRRVYERSRGSSAQRRARRLRVPEAAPPPPAPAPVQAPAPTPAPRYPRWE
ncbi:MAG: protein kinase [Deltaproteobacteria bacterium]|nr:protein kinase [Deltaproteobacteria bacterium]